jgi:hypothetical protein
MSNYDNNQTFVLFVNDKGDNPKRPDRTGTATIDGVEYKLSGWLATDQDGSQKKDKNGNPFLKGKIEARDGQASQSAQRAPQRQAPSRDASYGDVDDSSEIPF